MRTIFLTFIVALTSTLTFAQTSEHLLFKGVPVDGTLNEYVSKMKQSGFTHILTDDGTAILNGDFAGYKDCSVRVATLKQKDLVYKIAVNFPNKDTWSRLSANYLDLKEMLTEKYGKPSDKVEKFDGYSQPENDFSKMSAVYSDRCKFYSVWNTDKGEIQLSIDHESMLRCFVKILYFDKVNGAIINAKAKDDL
jgi:hypothetical protein